MIRWIIDRWYMHQRAIDLNILWPACRDQARDLEAARRAFMIHALHDTAWMHLGREEIERRVRELV